MNLTCKSCGRSIPAQNVNIERAIAKCSACHAVFNFLDQIGGAAARLAVRQRPPVQMPRAFQVDEWGGELTLTRRWFHWGAIFFVFFCVFWNGFLVVWYSIAWNQKQILMMLFPLIHVAVGVGLTYATVANLFNKTWIRVGHGQLTIRHGPIPWGGNRALFAHDIRQLYCTEKVHRTKNGHNYTYEVYATLADGESTKLLSGLENSQHALFVEQKLEEHLKLIDEPVPGEIPR